MMLSEYLINEHMPEGYKLRGPVTKKVMTEALARLARERPDDYPEVAFQLKKLGDTFATYEGLSVGLDDITPNYAAKTQILKETDHAMKLAKNPGEMTDALLEGQRKALLTLKTHDSALSRQIESGSRGKAGQLLKTVFSPIVAKGKNDAPQAYLIRNSYSEGLSPGEFWITAGESRKELAMTQLATAIPGDTSKQITATLNGVMVMSSDCKTTNGISYDVDDPHIIDRYEAKTNRLIDSGYARSLKRSKRETIVVRSPMTCRENPGVCQKCYGRLNTGQAPSLGTNLGLRSAHALSEPLTQMILSAKHGGFMAKGDDAKLHGTMGFRQLLDIPQVFKYQAVLSRDPGAVTKIENSPQGGQVVFVGDNAHYADPKREVRVKVGQKVEKGQLLTDGVANPKDVLALRGLGAARQYMNSAIYDIYKDAGIDMDKRHVELLVKQDLNHVKITQGDDKGSYLRGDIVPYNKLRDHLAKNSRQTKLTKDLIGQRLGNEYLHFTAGTTVDQNMLDQLKDNKIKKVSITKKEILFEPVMRSLEQIPLMGEDWVSRLAHRRLKSTLLEGAAKGWESATKGTAPYPALLYGTGTFGPKETGHY